MASFPRWGFKSSRAVHAWLCSLNLAHFSLPPAACAPPMFAGVADNTLSLTRFRPGGTEDPSALRFADVQWVCFCSIARNRGRSGLGLALFAQFDTFSTDAARRRGPGRAQTDRGSMGLFLLNCTNGNFPPARLGLLPRSSMPSAVSGSCVLDSSQRSQDDRSCQAQRRPRTSNCRQIGGKNPCDSFELLRLTPGGQWTVRLIRRFRNRRRFRWEWRDCWRWRPCGGAGAEAAHMVSR